MGNIKYLLGFFKKSWPKLVLKGIFVVMIMPLGFLEPMLNKYLFDLGIMEKNLKAFVIMLVLIAGLGIFSAVVEYFLSIFDQMIINDIRREILKRFLNAFFNKGSIDNADEGYLINRFYSEPMAVVISFLNQIFSILSTFLMLLSRFFAMLILSPIAIIFLLPFSIVSYIIGKKLQVHIENLSRNAAELEAKTRGVIGDVLTSWIPIKTFNLDNMILRKITRIFEDYLGLSFNTTKKMGMFDVSMRILSISLQTGFIIINAILVFVQRITFGDFMGFLTAFYPFLTYLRGFFEIFPEIIRTLSLSDRIREVEERSDIWVPEYSEIIELIDIHFSYNSTKVFEGLNLKILNGEKVLITGSNGSGKTTLLKIIAGFLKPYKGKVITYKRISYLPEKFPNIKIYEVKEALNNELFSNLLKDFSLDEEKSFKELSTGQKKKFLIALTLSRDADCYILDEPTEGISPEDKGKILNKIFDLTRGKTLIIVSHDNVVLENKTFTRVINLDKVRRIAG